MMRERGGDPLHSTAASAPAPSAEPPAEAPVRLAVIFDQVLHSGGGFQQSISAALDAARVDPALCDVRFYTTIRENGPALERLGLEARPLHLTLAQRLYGKLRRATPSRRAIRAFNRWLGPNPLDARLARDGIELAYFLSPSPLAGALDRLPFVFTLWDLGHRDVPEFPEVAADQEFVLRERLFNKVLPRATAVVVDSQHGADGAVRRYGLDADRVIVSPHQASRAIRAASEPAEGVADVKARYGLGGDYVLYPAQFWPHKNHVYLLKGLAALERRFGRKVWAVLPGSDQGNLGHVKATAEALGLADRVRFPGFVADAEMPDLYRQALALVMPTFMGPTNLPPLEAFRMGVPVLYSDLPGLRDQVRDAALLLDLEDPEDLGAKLEELVRSPALRARLVDAGRAHADQPRDDWLEPLLRRFLAKRACWPRA